MPTEPMIYIKDGKVFVKTLDIKMSTRQKVIVIADLLLTVFISVFFTTFVLIIQPSLYSLILMVFLSTIAVIGAVGLTVCDLSLWMIRMQNTNREIGERYCKDVSDICNDLIRAGCKVAAEAADKARND